MGGNMRGVRSQLVWGGAISGVFGGMILAALTAVLTVGTFIAVNNVIIPFSRIPLRYIFEMPWTASAAGMAVGLACAFFPCIIPFYFYRRRVNLSAVTDPTDY